MGVMTLFEADTEDDAQVFDEKVVFLKLSSISSRDSP